MPSVSLQMEQLEVKHKAELSSFMRNEERELEQLRTTFEKDLDKLRQSHKTDLEKRVSCKTNHIILIDNCFFLVQTRSQRGETFLEGTERSSGSRHETLPLTTERRLSHYQGALQESE